MIDELLEKAREDYIYYIKTTEKRSFPMYDNDMKELNEYLRKVRNDIFRSLIKKLN